MSTVLTHGLTTAYAAAKRMITRKKKPKTPTHDQMLGDHEARKMKELRMQLAHKKLWLGRPHL